MSESKTLQQLASVERNGGKEQLIISLDEFTADNGRASQYVNVRLWFKGNDGGFMPSKKGITFRKAEIQEVGKALRAALDYFNQPEDENRFARSNRQPTSVSAQPPEPSGANSEWQNAWRPSVRQSPNNWSW